MMSWQTVTVQGSIQRVLETRVTVKRNNCLLLKAHLQRELTTMIYLHVSKESFTLHGSHVVCVSVSSVMHRDEHGTATLPICLRHVSRVIMPLKWLTAIFNEHCDCEMDSKTTKSCEWICCASTECYSMTTPCAMRLGIRDGSHGAHRQNIFLHPLLQLINLQVPIF